MNDADLIAELKKLATGHWEDRAMILKLHAAAGIFFHAQMTLQASFFCAQMTMLVPYLHRQISTCRWFVTHRNTCVDILQNNISGILLLICM
jgi:hypothetical protein